MIPSCKVAVIRLHAHRRGHEEVANPFLLAVAGIVVPPAGLVVPPAGETLAGAKAVIGRVAALEPAVLPGHTSGIVLGVYVGDLTDFLAAGVVVREVGFDLV